MKKLYTKLLLLTILVLLVTFGVNALYRMSTKSSYNLPSHLLPEKSLKEGYQIIKVGNSHAQSGINFKNFDLHSLDLSGVAQRFSFDLALLKQHKRQIEPNAIILISISPISFSHNKPDESSSFQNMYYSRVSPFLIPDLNISNYLQSELFPFLRSGYLLRKNNQTKIIDRISAEEKWEEPEQIVNTISKPVPTPPYKQIEIKKVKPVDKYSNVEVINKELDNSTYLPNKELENHKDFIYKKWNESDKFNSSYFEYNKENLDEIIEYSIKNNWRPVLVTVPISKILINGLDDGYMQIYMYSNLGEILNSEIDYFDYMNDERLTNNNYIFANTDHLNEKGSKIFSYVLLQDLIKNEYITKNVDLYSYDPFY